MMAEVFVVVLTVSVLGNFALWFLLNRAVRKLYEYKDAAEVRQDLLVKAVAAVNFYNKNIAKGTVELPKLDPFHGEYE